ncbi:E3 ubiquitin-protein ligase Mdm2 isoform X2 [Aplysia californica]|uniref:E3 ubiquitin-protein ligase Mdm2 isoform X2 n=1 Tax=Aplysia californica TaxID=6500 RepID=A0ABM0ZYP2_APLCA|nr:E3 ubiquitin-protein ligase Mdm2 isoform X2 [Aplysia californica]
METGRASIPEGSAQPLIDGGSPSVSRIQVQSPLSTTVTVAAAHTSSLPSSCGSSDTVPTTTPTTQYVLEEKTTTVRVPMLRPRPALLKVLQLAGGIGETYTLKEIIGLVQEYIQERKLYDENNPHMVYCGADLLGEALRVQQFSVMEALGLFHRNCSLEPDSCIRIRRQLVTRAVTVPASDASSSGTALFSTAGLPASANTSLSSSLSSTSASGCSSVLSQLPTSGASNIPTEQVSCTPESSGSLSSSLPSSGSQASSQKSSSSPQSVSSSTTVLTGATSPSVVVKQSELDAHLHTKEGDQVVTSTDSSSDGDENKRKDRKRKSDENQVPSGSVPRRRSTSVSVKCDEIDGGSGPWQCEVMVETSAAGSALSPQDDTVVVEYESDAFSVEYEVESSSEHEQQPPSQDAQGSGTSRDRGCSESDVSSSTSGTAILVVCKESDVEYLADYSDSDFGSDAELSDADKWFCKHCSIKNPPFQRNCAGCWSVRPDWLPVKGKVTRCEEKTDESCASASCDAVLSQESGLGSSKSTMEADQDNDLKSAVSNVATPVKDSVVSPVKKRKYSSCLETSDSQEDKKRPLSRPKLEGKEACSRKSESSTDEHVKAKGKKKASSSLPNPADPCVVCLSRSKSASIIHGKTGHQVCCYRCAKRLKEQRKACPICRRPIQKVVRNYYL